MTNTDTDNGLRFIRASDVQLPPVSVSRLSHLVDDAISDVLPERWAFLPNGRSTRHALRRRIMDRIRADYVVTLRPKGPTV
jgi:hypothetical protein